jgi:hypothetical protein
MSTDMRGGRGVVGRASGAAPARTSPARLSRAESESALGLIQECMSNAGVCSVYELFVSTELKRSTLYRWFADAELGRVTELPIAAVRAIAEALAVEGDSVGPLRELSALLDVAERRDAHNAELIAEFKARRISYWRALAAIRAAGHRLVPIEDGAKE